MNNIKLSELKQSEQILEIRKVNPVFVSRYRQAMREGDNFPPLIITKDNVIVSGNHRYEAYIDEYEEDHRVKCKVKAFADEAEMIETAIKENATHGNPLDGISRKRAILKLIELGRDEEKIASLLGCSVKRIVSMAGQHVIVRGNGKRPVKHGLEHMAGKTISKKQYEEHTTADRSMSVSRQCEQLVRWLDNGWVDLDNPKNGEALIKLAEAIEKNISVPA
jgi:hypothetical protein